MSLMCYGYAVCSLSCITQPPLFFLFSNTGVDMGAIPSTSQDTSFHFLVSPSLQSKGQYKSLFCLCLESLQYYRQGPYMLFAMKSLEKILSRLAKGERSLIRQSWPSWLATLGLAPLIITLQRDHNGWLRVKKVGPSLLVVPLSTSQQKVSSTTTCASSSSDKLPTIPYTNIVSLQLNLWDTQWSDYYLSVALSYISLSPSPF